MHIIESTPFAVRSAVMRLEANSETVSFTLFPMVHVGSPSFYDEIAKRLENCDIVLCEGVKSPISNLLTMSYRFFADTPRIGLALQRRMDLSQLNGRLVHADVTGPEFEKRWSELPLLMRFCLPLAAPVYGLYMRYFGTRTDIAERLGMHLRKSRREVLEDSGVGTTREVMLDWRDRHLIDVIARERTKAAGQEVNIGILFGARHMKAVLRYLLSDCGFRAVSSEWVTVFEL